jgi:hypothetical protein
MIRVYYKFLNRVSQPSWVWFDHNVTKFADLIRSAQKSIDCQSESKSTVRLVTVVIRDDKDSIIHYIDKNQTTTISEADFLIIALQAEKYT